MTAIVTSLVLASVTFVDCPKCDKRMRIADDGRTATVNLSRIKPSEKAAMEARAQRFLELARPVEFANPKTNDLVWKDVSVSEPGEYTLTVSYWASEDRTLFLQIDDGAPLEIATPRSPKGSFQKVSQNVSLKKGVHSVRIFNPTAYTADIDCMTLTRK